MTALRSTRVRVAAVLGAGAAAVALILAGSDDGTYELRASFKDVRGLIVGGDVRAGAVEVGTVTAIVIDEDTGDPEVTMEIDESFKLYRGAFADIRLASNVGAVNRTVELDQGDITAPPLEDGGRLSARSTDEPVNFDQAVDALDRPMRRRLGQVLSGLGDAVGGRGGDVDALLQRSGPALSETTALLEQVNSDGEALSTLVENGERVTSALAADRAGLGSATVRVAELLRTTAGRQSELRATVRALAPALAGGRDVVTSLDTQIPSLRRLAQGLRPLGGAARPLLRRLPDATEAAGPLVEETRGLVEEGPERIADLRPIVLAASPVAEKLTKVAKDALPLARVLQVYIPETVGAFQNFGATAASYDANGHILNVASSILPVPAPSTLGSELGASDCDPSSPTLVKPGKLRKPFIRTPGVNECQPWRDAPGLGAVTAEGGG